MQQVRIRQELQIPVDYDAEAIYKRLKRDLQATNDATPWFQVELQGLGTQLWTFEARLNLGVMIQFKRLRTNIRKQILESFKSHLPHDLFEAFLTSFS